MTTKNNSQQDEPKKVFDVSRPGKTLAETTSKPVIVGHRPQVQDPMMMHPNEQRPLMDAKRKVAVVPSAPVVPQQPEQKPEQTTTDPEAKPSSTKPTAEAEAGAVPDVQVAAPLAEAVEPPQPTAVETPSAPTPVTAEPSTPAAPEPKPLPQQTEPEDSVAAILLQGAKEAEIPPISAGVSSDPLPDISGAHVYPPTTMIVSHHDKGARVGKIVLWALLLLLLAVVIVDVLLDAGFFVLSVPHTDFF